MKFNTILLLAFFTKGCTPDWGEYVAEEGSSKECINEYGEALKIYDKGIHWNTNSTLLYWRRGCLHSRNEHYELAIKDLSRSILLDPQFNTGYAYWDRALAKEAIGDSLGALSDYNNAIKINPQKENFYCFRGVLKYQMKDFTGALVDLDHAIQLWDNYYIARSWRSSLRVKLGDYTGALEDFKFLETTMNDGSHPSSAVDFRDRGIAKYGTGDTLGACKDWIIAARHQDSIAIRNIREHCH